MPARTFSLAFLALLLLVLGAIAAFNFVVDPFWYFRAVERHGFNLVKPRAAENEAWVKPALAARLRPSVVIVGNSFSEIGLPPTHPGLAGPGATGAFNLSLHGASWDDIYCLARFAITTLHVRRLVVSVYGVDAAACPADAEFARADYGRLLLSRLALDASRQTLREQDGPPTLTREGLWTMARYDTAMQDDGAIAVNFARNLKTALCDTPGGDPGPADPRRVDRTPAPADRGLGLRQLIRLARLHRVELVLIFNPTHVLFNEVTRRCAGAQGHWQYLWQVASIVDQETAGAAKGVELWDFHAWGPYTGERIHAGVPMRDRLWQDTGHFNPEVGTHVFAAIYGDERDFGARITVADFDANLARVEAQRTAFLAANAWIDDEIREIQARARTLRDLAPTPRMLPAAVRDR